MIGCAASLKQQLKSHHAGLFVISYCLPQLLSSSFLPHPASKLSFMVTTVWNAFQYSLNSPTLVNWLIHSEKFGPVTTPQSLNIIDETTFKASLLLVLKKINFG